MDTQRSMSARLRGAAILLLIAVAWLATGIAHGEPAAIPASLQPWIDWVLDARDQRACALAGADEPVCAWPGHLQLDLDDRGGRFDLSWMLQAEQWVPLPGGVGQWPQQVSRDGKPVAVLEREGAPSVRLPAGEHRISGRFSWPRVPDILRLPSAIALVSLQRDGAASPLRVDQRGGLWLGARPSKAQTDEPERLRLEVARRVEDRLPLRVQTRLLLEVGGPPREVLLGPVLLPGGLPLRLESPLPARLVRRPNADERPDASPAKRFDDLLAERPVARNAQPGRAARSPAWLQVQVRPGRWVLTFETQHPGRVEALRLPESRPVPEAIWPAQEVWVFAAEPRLRQVALSGGQRFDPRQARLPEAWRQLPARLMQPGQTLGLKTLRRGAAGSDQVHLRRVLRLDFDGDGFSIRDRLSGQLEVRSRLEAEPLLRLGQVRAAGEPRLITRLPGTEAREGVEVRPGPLAMRVDARLETGPVAFPQRLPISGWSFPLTAVSNELLLPPGWDLLAVAGVDNLPATWVGRWSLLDLFLVLVAALAVTRLWGPGWGMLALLTLVLTWQAPGAPRWSWLLLILAAALLRGLQAPADQEACPQQRIPGWLARLVRLYFGAAVLGFALIAVPFLVTEMRAGLFPQLAAQGGGLTGLIAPPEAPHALSAEVAVHERAGRSLLESKMADAVESIGAPLQSPDVASPPSVSALPQRLPSIDPDARLQTGPGVPDWTWRRFQLGWNGPLPAGQSLWLWLLPPWGTLLLALLTLVLVPLLGLRLMGWRPGRLGSPQGAPLGLIGLSVAAWLVLQSGAAQATTLDERSSPTGFPPPVLLEELERRLRAPPDCAPRCAEIARMQLELAGEQLRLVLAVEAAAAVALPVPGDPQGWLPNAIQLDGQPWQRLRRAPDDRLLVPIARGRHLLQLSGPLPAVDTLVLPLPLRPRLLEARLGPGWTLAGVNAAGVPGEQVQLSRAAGSEGGAAAQNVAQGGPSARFPPLLRVTRTLRFGLDWQIETKVQRLSPADGPVSLRLPLIAGESVNSDAIPVNAAGALIALGPRQQTLSWQSTLEPVARLRLTASEETRISEEWRLAVSPLWHLETEGLPPVQPQRGATERVKAYRPWPGESLLLHLSRPLAVAGEQLTLDRSLYRITPGRRTSEARLELLLRSTQGGRYRLPLPSGAELTQLRVDGQALPLLLQAQTLDLPLRPGLQRIEIGWREREGLGWRYQPTRLALGIAGVNAETHVRLPSDRWVLFTRGPGIGPAVQFWALLLALTVLAWLLARARSTPLGFVAWLLLAIGLSQVSIWVGALVVLWLFALGWRQRLSVDHAPWRFNLAQIGLVLLSIAALSALLSALEQGLLGAPAMQIAGNGSTAGQLQWYLDRQSGATVSVTVMSAPIWVYRLLMLAWALWLAWRLLGWLRWGWRNMMSPVPWRRFRRRPEQRATDDGLRVDL